MQSLNLELRDLAITLLGEGYPREEVVSAFERALDDMRLEGREAEEDALMDVLDFFVGWCPKHLIIPEVVRPDAWTSAH